MNQDSKPTCLFDIHRQHNAKLTSFFGFTLPLWYTSIKDEHHAVRTHSGIFDISHMGLLRVSGEGSRRFLDHMSCNTLDKITRGFWVYTMLLNHDGGIRDDIMVGMLDQDYLLVVNASNTEKIVGWLNSHKPHAVKVDALNSTHGLLAIQGPASAQQLSAVLTTDVSAIPSFGLRIYTYNGTPIVVSRTGYTGEDGFELLMPHQMAPVLFESLRAIGATPCGLGARDSLRIEAGLPLYGQELSETLSPLTTRYADWVVKFKHPFLGRHALETSPQELTTVGLVMEGTAIPRTGYPIVEGGHITSGTLSPTLGKPIGMALVPKHYALPGTALHVQIRNKPEKATVTMLPFVSKTPPLPISA